MSVMAIAIAEHKSLNIVTSEPHVHYAVLTRREQDIFEILYAVIPPTAVTRHRGRANSRPRPLS